MRSKFYNYSCVIPVLLQIDFFLLFRTVFEQIHVNSNEVWKWEMYRLVGEYDQRPGLPAPLVVIELIYKVLKSIWKKTCRRKKENRKYNRNIIITEHKHIYLNFYR